MSQAFSASEKFYLFLIHILNFQTLPLWSLHLELTFALDRKLGSWKFCRKKLLVLPSTRILFIHLLQRARKATGVQISEDHDLGIPVYEKLSVSQQCVLGRQKFNAVLCSIKTNGATRLREVIFHPYSALLRLHLEYYCIWFWDPSKIKIQNC